MDIKDAMVNTQTLEEAHTYITEARTHTTVRLRVPEGANFALVDPASPTCLVHVSMLEDLCDLALTILGELHARLGRKDQSATLTCAPLTAEEEVAIEMRATDPLNTCKDARDGLEQFGADVRKLLGVMRAERERGDRNRRWGGEMTEESVVRVVAERDALQTMLPVADEARGECQAADGKLDQRCAYHRSNPTSWRRGCSSDATTPGPVDMPYDTGRGDEPIGGPGGD